MVDAGPRWPIRLPTLICAGPTVTARLGNAAQPLLFETGPAAALTELFARWLEEPACFTEGGCAAERGNHAATASRVTAITR